MNHYNEETASVWRYSKISKTDLLPVFYAFSNWLVRLFKPKVQDIYTSNFYSNQFSKLATGSLN